jgi:hypothetical protein
MNPEGLKQALEEESRKLNLKINVAAIYGDDVTVSLEFLRCFSDSFRKNLANYRKGAKFNLFQF